MPYLTGLEAIKVIRKFDKETPICMASANEWAEDLARKAGANDFVFKDMNYGVNLLEIVAKYFR